MWGVVKFILSLSPKHTGALIPLFAPICRHLFVHLWACGAWRGHSYCSQLGLNRLKTWYTCGQGTSLWSWEANPFPERPVAAQHSISMSSILCPCPAPHLHVQHPVSMSSTPCPCPSTLCPCPHMDLPASCNLCREKGVALISCSLLCCASNIASKIMLSWDHVCAHSWHLSPPFLSFKPEQKDSWEGLFWISFEFQRTTLLLCFKTGSNSC